MRYTTAGESHGRALTALITGVPAGIPIRAEDIDRDLARRQRGYGRGRTPVDRDRSRRRSCRASASSARSAAPSRSR